MSHKRYETNSSYIFSRYFMKMCMPFGKVLGGGGISLECLYVGRCLVVYGNGPMIIEC
jgi:hypothetical protein